MVVGCWLAGVESKVRLTWPSIFRHRFLSDRPTESSLRRREREVAGEPAAEPLLRRCKRVPQGRWWVPVAQAQVVVSLRMSYE